MSAPRWVTLLHKQQTVKKSFVCPKSCTPKNSKNWNALINYRNCPKISTIWFFSAVFSLEDEDNWQTVKTLIRLLHEEQSDLGLHCLLRPICPNI